MLPTFLSTSTQAPTAAPDPVAPRAGGKSPWRLVLLIGGGLVLALIAFLLLGEGEHDTLASIPVRQGEFVISQVLKSGELEAVNSVNIQSPQVRGSLKIVHLFPEGEQVEIGDMLVQFEPTEFQKRVTEAEQSLEAAKAELEKYQATQKAEIATLEAAIKDQQANLQLANLQLERMVFEATIKKEETRIQALQAQLNYDQATEKLATQKVVDAAEIKKLELDIARQERDLEQANKDLESLTINAETPGLVVYGKVWKGGGHEKVRVGDDIWRGVKVISLPDLSRMQVKTFVNEVDVDKIEVEQPVLIKLDALPEPTFHGTITTIASLGREKEGEKNVKVFDVTVTIDEGDERLKPGMSASSEVVIQTIPPRPEVRPDSVQQAATEEVAETAPLPLYIPLDAVFEQDGQTVVYRLLDGEPVPQAVVLGPQNANHVVVENGLEPDDRIILYDPTTSLDAIGGLGGGSRSANQSVSAE